MSFCSRGRGKRFVLFGILTDAGDARWMQQTTSPGFEGRHDASCRRRLVILTSSSLEISRTPQGSPAGFRYALGAAEAWTKGIGHSVGRTQGKDAGRHSQSS